MTDEALKDIRQKMNESLPNETEDLFDYVGPPEKRIRQDDPVCV